MNGDSVWRWGVAFGFLASWFVGSAHASSLNMRERIEVPVGNIFVPTQGYDDNDVVQVVIDGILPNGCYSIAAPEHSVDLARRQVHIRLFAFRRQDPICAHESRIPISLAAPVPYTLTVAVGVLPAGEYQVRFPRPGLDDGLRNFVVERARVSTMDDVPYAAVTSVEVPERVYGNRDVWVSLVGVLTSSCSSLGDNIQIIRTDEVITILPKLVFDPSQPCKAVSIPFRKMVSIGKPGEGRFLVQVRSMNGQSVTRTFSAVMPDPE